MRHQSIQLEHSPDLSIPPGWLFLGVLAGSWAAVIGVAHIGVQLFSSLTGA